MDVGWINLQLIGYILMGAGVLVFLIGIILLARRRSTETVSRTSVDPGSNEQVTRQRTTSTDDGTGL